MGGRGTKSVANLAALLGRARRDNAGGSGDANLQATAPSPSIQLDITNNTPITKGGGVGRRRGAAAKVAALTAQTAGGGSISVRVPPGANNSNGSDGSTNSSSANDNTAGNSDAAAASANQSLDKNEETPPLSSESLEPDSSASADSNSIVSSDVTSNFQQAPNIIAVDTTQPPAMSNAPLPVIPNSYSDVQAIYTYWPGLEDAPMPKVDIADPDKVSDLSGYIFADYLENNPDKDITKEDWAALVGAPPGAKVTVSSPFSEPTIIVEVEHKWYRGTQQRTISRRFDGRNLELVLHGDYFGVNSRSPKGTGLRVFAMMVKTARTLGIKKIETHAAGDSSTSANPDTERGRGWNGYYTWPRFGYNAPLPDSIRYKLPEHLQDAEDLQDLNALPGGADWWKENGVEIDLEFDLSDGSKSMAVLQQYLKIRGIEWE